MDKNLFSYISSIENKVWELQKEFYNEWNELVKEHFSVDQSFDIRKYIDEFGGFWLDGSEYDSLAPELKRFFDARIQRGNRVFLRGYDYYVFDPILNLRTSGNKHVLLWKSFREKWNSYQSFRSYSFIDRFMNIADWIAALGYLEYIFSDLTSIQWFVYRNHKELLKMYDHSLQTLEKDMENLVDHIGAAIAYMLDFDFDRARFVLENKCIDLFHSKVIYELLYTDFHNIEKASMRTMREGDSLALVYAAFRLKLKPFCIDHKFQRIRIVSNAFGAMNTGVIMKHLLSNVCEADHTNILYAQHRSEGDVVYADKLINKCYVVNDESRQTVHYDAAIVIDDSICLGRSFYKIEEYLKSDNVFMLPLTLNCNGMKYFRVGVNSDDNVAQLIHNSLRLSEKINNTLPPFFSFWDFRRVVPDDSGYEDENYKFAMCGSDMLLRHLWIQYENEILSNMTAYGE